MRLVLFDIDGTLLHSSGCGRVAARLAIQEVFGTVGELDRVNLAGKTDWQTLLESLEPAGVSRDRVQVLLETFDHSVARHLADVIAGFPVRPCDGAPAVVAALRENPAVLIGLVTGNMAGLVPIKLRAAGYDPHDFKIGAFGSEGWTRDMLPPLALARAKAYSGAEFAPDEVVIIGDTPGDIISASSIQARTIAVATGPYSVGDLSEYGPDYVFETMADRDAVLSAILRDGHA